jgi:DNA processing protein
MNNERVYWIALNMVKGIGAVRFRALVDSFGSPAAAWAASPEQLRKSGLIPSAVENLIQLRSALDLNQVAADLERHKVKALILSDEDYPRRLREVDQAPPVLYVRGELLPEDEWAVAVVGTRRVSAYGQQVAEQLGIFLAQHNITSVSGLARGVDAIAHQATLRAGGRTIAVMAHGLDRVYPAEHRRLADEIVAQGALVSDYGIGIAPDGANFPPRNRIISGLSIATVVVEAGAESGALITAGFAADQGREVFALPGNIFAPQSKGSNMLIQRGAHPLLHFEELLEALNLQNMGIQKVARVELPADATEAKLLGFLSHEPLHVNEIGALAGLPIQQVSSTLALMELKGLARQVGGMNYIAARETQGVYQTNARHGA